MNHELKIWPNFYKRVKDGSKTFEIRSNEDRGFQMGDTVELREWDPDFVSPTDTVEKGYTGSENLKFKIGYVHILSSAQVVFSLLPLTKAK